MPNVTQAHADAHVHMSVTQSPYQVEVVLFLRIVWHHWLLRIKELHEVELHVVRQKVLHNLAKQQSSLELAQPVTFPHISDTT